MAKIIAVHEANAAIRKKWLKSIVKNPRRWKALQQAIGMELIPEPLGCGSFGCVFAAADPSSPWVVKLTIDPHEAAMWQTILELAEREGYGDEGYTHIKDIVRLKPDVVSGKKKLKTHAIVREAIAPIMDDGGLTEFSRRVVGEEGFGELKDILTWIHKYHEASMYIYDRRPSARRRPMKFSYGYGPQSMDDAKNRIRRAIDMIKGGYGSVLGETLELLFANGIVLNDLRTANVGWRFLPQFLEANEDNVFVLFDPGFTDTGRRDLPEPREAFIENPEFEWYVTESIAR